MWGSTPRRFPSRDHSLTIYCSGYDFAATVRSRTGLPLFSCSNTLGREFFQRIVDVGNLLTRSRNRTTTQELELLREKFRIDCQTTRNIDLREQAVGVCSRNSIIR